MPRSQPNGRLAAQTQLAAVAEGLQERILRTLAPRQLAAEGEDGFEGGREGDQLLETPHVHPFSMENVQKATILRCKVAVFSSKTL